MLFAAFGVLASACAGDGGSGGSGGGLSAVAALPGPVGRADEVPTGRAVTGGRRLDVAVYYLRTVGAERYLAAEAGTVPFSVSVDRLAREVVTELLTGRPRFLGMERPFPVGTRLLGLRLAGGTAVVNLSREALGAANADGYALQTLVWTVTQLPQVRGVVVRVEGRSGGLLGGGRWWLFWGLGGVVVGLSVTGRCVWLRSCCVIRLRGRRWPAIGWLPGVRRVSSVARWVCACGMGAAGWSPRALPRWLPALRRGGGSRVRWCSRRRAGGSCGGWRRSRSARWTLR